MSSHRPQAPFPWRKWRSYDFMICNSSVEVFPPAAGAFFSGKNDVPMILWHVLALLRSSHRPQALFFRRKWRSWYFMTCISRVEVFPPAASAFFRQKWRSWSFMTCISPVEVFPGRRRFFSGRNDTPSILWHVLGLVGSSRLPQARFFIKQWLTNGFGYICDRRGMVKAHSLKGLAFTNGSGFG